MTHKITARIFRNGHADETQFNVNRKLTDEGIRASRNLGIRWKEQGFKPELAFSSSAQRAIDTMQLALTEIQYIKDDQVSKIPIAVRKGLYLGTNEGLALLAPVFQRLGNTTLNTYLHTEAASGLIQYGANALRLIHRELRRYATLPSKIVIGGHAVLAPTVGYFLSNLQSQEALEVILGEAEDFEVQFEI